MVTVTRYKPDTVRAAFVEFFAYGPSTAEDDAGEIRMYCPVCEDPATSKTPSASINPEMGKWNCLTGNHGGSIKELAKQLKDRDGWDIRSAALKAKHQDPDYRAEVNESLARAGKRAAALPTATRIEEWNAKLLSTPAALRAITTERGLTQATLVDYEIGWDGDRYTIPVYDVNGELLNVRRYKLNAARAQDKMLNIPGRGTAAMYNLPALEKGQDIVIAEGEMDCLLLNQEGIPAVTHTAGAATFRPQWAQLFKGKNVYIAYDNDETGKKGAKKVESMVGAHAEAVFTIVVPLDHKGADVTDYIHKEGYSADDFRTLMKDAEQSFVGAPTNRAPILETGKRVSLVESMSEENQNEALEMVVSVAGKQQEPYTAPRKINVSCDMSKGAPCTMCPIAAQNGSADFELRPDDEQLYRFVDSTEERRRKLLREVTGARCSDRSEFTVDEDYHIEELLVQPSVDERRDDESQHPVRRTVFSVSTHRSTVNEKIRVVAKNVPDPKTGKLRLMSWVNQRVDLDIDNFELTDDVRDRLEQFQPDEDQSPLDKCLEIAGDLAYNVTGIKGRDILHVAYDLVFHSVLNFKVKAELVEKGWLEMMVIGDTRTGKSEIAKNLSRHYRAGQMLSCEGMSFAGIVGGVQQIDGRWHMTWGAVPMNDRRLVVLDEVSGLAEKGIIDQMSSIRSAGIAQITKIQSEQASARTRLIWISNPADGSMLSSKAEAGMAGIRSVVPANEDLARFDFVCAAAKSEVDDAIINNSFSDSHDPSYRSADCEELVKWAWSLGRDDVVVTDAAAAATVSASMDLGSRYIADPPFIQSENVRYKVLRIAAAMAARTFSCSPTGKLIVKLEHVKDAVRFLDTIYGSEALGYARKSKRSHDQTARAASRRAPVKAWLLDHSGNVLHTLRLVGASNFRPRDFYDYGGMEKDATTEAIKSLINKGMVTRMSRGDLQMTPTLVDILREIDDDEEKADRDE